MRSNLTRVICALMGIVAISSQAAHPKTSAARTIDLGRNHNTVFLGAILVAAPGDVNGDRISDLAFSRCAEEDDQRGRSWIVFGSPELPKRLSLESLGEFGFAIEGAQPEDCAFHVSGAGDVNADGLDDIVVGAMGADPHGRSSAGAAYVIFGKSNTSTVNLSDFDGGTHQEQGFRIVGGSGRSLLGRSVAGVGDINDDGNDDLLVEAAFAGAAYVVYGKTDSIEVDLEIFNAGLADDLDLGFRIDHPVPNRSNGTSVAAAGDVNGDGTPDMMVGVIKKLSSRGTVYVIFGDSQQTGSIDVTELGDDGFVIEGRFGGSSAGSSMTSADDLNGDGLDDLLIGAHVNNHCARPYAYVVLGKTDQGPVDLGKAWKHGWQIVDWKSCSQLGQSVSSSEDVNGDGVPELLIGAPNTSPRCCRLAGATYLIYGRADSRTIRVAELKQKGVRIDGARTEDLSGFSVAGVGDIDGDGIPEALISGLSGRSHLVDLAAKRR